MSQAEEETNQQLFQNDKTKGQESVFSATVNMVKAFVGIGILALPSGFSSSGWLGGLLFFVICGGFIMYLSLKLLDVANKKESNARSVTEFSIECLGKKSEIWVNGFLFGIQLGICVAYVIFFSTYFQDSLCFFTDNDRSNSLCSSRVPSLLFSLILVGPSIFIRNMGKLKDWCFFANGLILISLFVIFVSCLLKMQFSYITSDYIESIRWAYIGKALGVFVFAFEGTTLYFEIRSSMKNQKEFKTVLKYSLGGGLIAYALIGLSGYLAFGSGVRDVILFNFPMNNPIYVFIQIFYCIAILLSYPLQMFPLVSIIELKLIENLKPNIQYSIVEEENDKKEDEKEDDDKQQQEQQKSNDQEPQKIKGILKKQKQQNDIPVEHKKDEDKDNNKNQQKKKEKVNESEQKKKEKKIKKDKPILNSDPIDSNDSLVDVNPDEEESGEESIEKNKDNEEQQGSDVEQQENSQLLNKNENDTDNNLNLNNGEVDEVNVELKALDAKGKKEFLKQSMILRVTCLLLVFVIAIMFNRLTVFLNLIGSIAGTFFCFILPVLVYEKNMPNISYQEFYLHRAIMTLGIIFAILGIASSLSSIF